jgi:hypothetical protein
MVQESQRRLKLNGACLVLPYLDDMNLQGVKRDTVKKNAETCIDASKDVGLESSLTEIKVYVAVSSPEYRAKSWHMDNKQIV